MQGRAETFDHEADVGIAGEGETIAEAFEQAARALFSLMTDLDRVRPIEAVAIHCTAPDRELMLVAWLNELLTEADLRGMLFSRFEVGMETRDHSLSLSGRAWGEGFDAAHHERGVEVKGATLTGLSVSRLPDGSWRACTVVDV